MATERVNFGKGGKASSFVKAHPALSLAALAMFLGALPILAITAGLLPEAYSQLVALSSSLAGIILAAVEGRKGGVRELLGRLLIWRVGLRWWVFALLGITAPAVASLYLFDLFGGPAVDWNGLKPLVGVVPSIIILTIFAGVGEELGWRGFALPRLQARHSALTSSLIIGVLWGMWHIPLFFAQGSSQFEWRSQVGLGLSLFGYVLFVIAWSIQYTWVFNNTKGSVLLAAVIHGAGNAFLGYIDVYRGHFNGIMTFTVVSCVLSLEIVLYAGRDNLSRTSARNVLT